VPTAGAYIKIDNIGRTTSALNGSYLVTLSGNPLSQSYTITASLSGYPDQTKTVTNLQNGQTRNLNWTFGSQSTGGTGRRIPFILQHFRRIRRIPFTLQHFRRIINILRKEQK